MSRKLLLIGAATFLGGVGALVASFQMSAGGEIIVQIIGAVLILISFILFGWHICGAKSKPQKKVLKSKNRMKRPKEISRNNYGHENMGGPQHEGGVSVIRPHGGSKRYNQSQRGGGGQRSGNSGYQQQQLQQQQIQQQYQQQQYPQQIQLQQQQYTQYDNGGGHGYVISADGYVQSVAPQDGSVMGGQYTPGYTGTGTLPLHNRGGVQINGGYSAGVQYNPGGRGTSLAASGGVNSGYRGSMDSINSANSNTGSQLSYDSDLSAGSLNTGRLRSSMKKSSNKDTSSMGSNTSKKSTRFAIVSEHTSV